MLRSAPRKGITVLTLLLLIIAVIIAAVFLFRYLNGRGTATSSIAAPVQLAPFMAAAGELTSSSV
jgi:flagellar basal body-associated protein FliL